jgi:hypothetical protein
MVRMVCKKYIIKEEREMKTKTKKEKRTELQKEIDGIIVDMSMLDTTSDEYKALADVLKTMQETRKIEVECFAKKRPSADTWVQVGGSLAAVVIICIKENVGSFVSKAIQFIPRIRG